MNTMIAIIMTGVSRALRSLASFYPEMDTEGFSCPPRCKTAQPSSVVDYKLLTMDGPNCCGLETGDTRFIFYFKLKNGSEVQATAVFSIAEAFGARDTESRFESVLRVSFPEIVWISHAPAYAHDHELEQRRLIEEVKRFILSNDRLRMLIRQSGCRPMKLQ